VKKKGKKRGKIQIQVNGSGSTGIAGPGMGTYHLDPRVHGSSMGTPWVNMSGSGTTRTAPNPAH